jgi:transglutaminase-like putative cysteine protease
MILKGKPFLFFAAVLLILSCRDEPPVIESISPRIGNLGELVTITGARFGPELDESNYITIGGEPPTSTSYVSWTDTKIVFRMPEFKDGGLVYVYRDGHRSNPVLFANRAVMPRPVSVSETGSLPLITGIEPASGAVGSLITIAGNNFGLSREGSSVWFSWNADPAPGTPAEARSPDMVEVFESDFGYDLWGERELRVRVPDGAISGSVEVRTPRGNSRPAYFEVTGKPGSKIFRDKRSYTLSFSVDVRIDEASAPNSLYLWLPKPVATASQRNIRLLSRSREPFVDNYRGVSLYQFVDTAGGQAEQVTVSYVADVYAVETSVKPAQIKENAASPVHSLYTLNTQLIPAADPGVATEAASIIGREKNPWNKALRIYEWLIKEISFETGNFSGGAIEALNEKRADSYRGALLFCALARAAGVPAMPAAGVLVNRTLGTTRHYWAEFWIDALGWVPVDPALGAGKAPGEFNLRENHADFYFGNMDSQRVAFSRGETILSPMDPRGRTAVRMREFALQNLWEEATGGLQAYTSLWSDVAITGMYIQ